MDLVWQGRSDVSLFCLTPKPVQIILTTRLTKQLHVCVALAGWTAVADHFYNYLALRLVRLGTVLRHQLRKVSHNLGVKVIIN